MLRPQVQLGYTMPDFVLEQLGGGTKPIAVYTDGLAFHATPAHNRVEDDAGKRAHARYDGYLVLALAWDELIRARDGVPEPKPWWFDSAAASNFASVYGLPLTALTSVTANPITQLMDWMQNPGKAEPRGESIADALPLLTRLPASNLVSAGSLSLIEFTSETLSGAVQPGEDPTTWQLRRGALAMTTRFLGEGRTDVVLMLDDRPAALTAEGFAEEWRLWLKLSNLLGARVNSDSATITTWKQSAASKPQLELVPDQGGAQSALPPQWAALLSTATSTEQAFLQALSEMVGLPLPDMGLEVGDGIPVSFAWPDIHLIADFELDERDHRDLEAAGWTVVPADAASIAAVLLPCH